MAALQSRASLEDRDAAATSRRKDCHAIVGVLNLKVTSIFFFRGHELTCFAWLQPIVHRFGLNEHQHRHLARIFDGKPDGRHILPNVKDERT